MRHNQLRLELRLDGQWERIDSVREAVGHSVAATFGDSDLRDSLAMVTAELLENALKYGEAEAGVELSIVSEPEAVVVTVGNAIKEDSPHLATLHKRLAWLRDAGDPFTAYTTALAELFERTGGDGGDSGLGFARIGYEGRCLLVCDTSRPGFVSVTARRQKSETVELHADARLS